MQFFSASQICLFAVAFGVALMLREGGSTGEESSCSSEAFPISCLKETFKKCLSEVICMSNFVFMLHFLLNVIYQGLTCVFFEGSHREHCTFITAP